MARATLSQLDDWQLEHQDQDLRGHPLVDQHGQPIGTVDDMIVDTEIERVVAVRLDNGAEYDARSFVIRDGKAVLRFGEDGLEAAEAGQAIPLVEEQLRALKRPVQIGEVEIRKEPVTEVKTIQVPLMREEVHVEQRQVEAGPADRALNPEGETIRVPILGEEAVVVKRPVVIGEVLVTKRPVQEMTHVSDTVRRTEVEVAHEGDVRIHGSGDQT